MTLACVHAVAAGKNGDCDGGGEEKTSLERAANTHIGDSRRAHGSPERWVQSYGCQALKTQRNIAPHV